MPASDWTAQLDQARAGLIDTAKMVRAYYIGLAAAGFTPEEALALTAQFQATAIQTAMALAAAARKDNDA